MTNRFSTVHPEVPDLSAAIRKFRRPPKLILLGDFGSGKSTLFHRLTQGVYTNDGDAGAQQCVDPSCCKVPSSSNALIRLPGESMALLCDTCSMEQFRSLTHGYYRGAACVILVADASNLHSVRNLEHWNTEAECYAPDASKILVFSKSDSAVADAGLINGDIESYQARLGCCRSAVVSAKTGRGIEQLKLKIAEACQEQRTRNNCHTFIVNSGSTASISLGGDSAQRSEDKDLFDLDFLKSCCS